MGWSSKAEARPERRGDGRGNSPFSPPATPSASPWLSISSGKGDRLASDGVGEEGGKAGREKEPLTVEKRMLGMLSKGEEAEVGIQDAVTAGGCAAVVLVAVEVELVPFVFVVVLEVLGREVRDVDAVVVGLFEAGG